MARPRTPKFELDPNGNLPEQVFRGINWQLSPKGAYLLTLSDAVTGEELLFPDRQIANGKRRGGSFATIPQFGNDLRDVESPQLPHGYGRITDWKPTRVEPHKVVFTHLQTGDGEYKGLGSVVMYELELGRISTKLVVALTLFNDSELVMCASPAMHPYIDLTRLDEDELVETQRELEVAQTVPAKEAAIDVGGGLEVVVASEGFGKMTWWAEPSSGAFVCIEPSVSGASFSRKPFVPTDAEILEPGESRDYRMSLTWRPAKHRAPR